MSLALNRRQLLRFGAAAAAAWQLQPWAAEAAAASLKAPATTSDPAQVAATLEAFADTMIPGRKRWAGDAAIAGVVDGPGSVEAGALTLMQFPPVGVAPVLPAVAMGLETKAATYALEQRLPPTPGATPFVGLDFAHRTQLAVDILDFGQADYLLYYAIAALAFLAFHTAAHLHTADAVRAGHPGLTRIGFPQPDADGLWRFPVFSYRRQMARPSPRTARTGSPT